MKKNQSLWIWKGLVPHCLRGQELALALLLREKPLTAAQEREYLRRCGEGDMEARNLLVEHNLRLVAHIIKKM